MSHWNKFILRSRHFDCALPAYACKPVSSDEFMSAWLHVLGSSGPEHEFLLQDFCSFSSVNKRMSNLWGDISALTAEERVKYRKLLEWVDVAGPEVQNALQACLQLTDSQVASLACAFCLTMINLIVVVVWKS